MVSPAPQEELLKEELSIKMLRYARYCRHTIMAMPLLPLIILRP